MRRNPEVYLTLFCPRPHFSNIGAPLLRIEPATHRRLSTAVCLLHIAFCLLLTAFCFLYSSRITVNAQGATATLSGTVTDPNDAVIPGVNIAVINTAQGFERSSTTNSSGTFVVPLLPPGNYTVKAEHEGFSPAEMREVVLNVNDHVAIKIQLKVGSIAGQTVTVTDASSLLDESPAVQTTIDRQFVQNLPLNGRSFQSLFSLTPGVTISKTSNFSRGQFSVNGQRTNTNNFIVDGVSANIGVSTADTIGQEAAGSVPSLTAFGGTNNLLSVDALQEFNIQTSTYAPEFGRSPGAQISLVSRSGTRDLHGALFEYFRNNVLDANDYFSNRAGLPRAQLRQNQFGFVVGGPIMLPRFGEAGETWLSGRNHSFFFVSYEGLRLRQPQTTTTNVVALRVRSLAPAGVRELLNALPIPTGPEIGVTGNAPFAATYSDQSTLNATSFRLDHNFNNRLLFGRFNYAPSEGITRLRSTPSNFTEIKLKTITLTVGATQTFSSATVNEIRFNYSRTNGQNKRQLDNFGGAVPLTVSQINPNLPAGITGSANINFFTGSYTLGDFDDNLQRQLNLVGSISHNRGSHALKFGIDYRRLTPVFQPRDYQAGYVFLSQGDVTSGRPTVAQIQGLQRTQPVFNNFSLYMQDTWRASRRLTVTYGGRWDINPPPSEADGEPAFVASSNNPLTAQLAPLGSPLWKTTYNNIAPRAGVAYKLSQSPGRELVLRGGFGLFYDLGNSQGGDAFTNGRFRTSLTPGTFFGVLYPLTAAQSVLPPFPTDGKATTTVAFDPDLKLPYTWQWNFSVERSLGVHQTLSAAYVGARARRLLRQRLFGSAANPNFLNLTFVDNGSTSDYNALQAQFTRRLSRHFQALASYTWSHAIDDVSSEVNFELARRADADFDVRHNLSAALHYESPWRLSGLKGKLVRNWQTDVIIHAQSAYPFTPFSRTTATIAGAIINVVPNRVEGVPLYLPDPLVAGGKRVNPAAFRSPPTGTQGNSGRNVLRGFPLYQVDFGIQRLFDLNEHFKFTFRVEAFNVFNHPNFATQQPLMTNPLFGQATQMLGQSFSAGGLSPIYQIGGPRSIQFSIRFTF